MINEYQNKIIQGDTLTILRNLPDEIVDMGVTSPPYNKGENKKGWLVKNVKYSGAIDKFSEEQYQKNQDLRPTMEFLVKQYHKTLKETTKKEKSRNVVPFPKR